MHYSSVSAQRTFIKTVGSMPFTGKHDIRQFYGEGVRACRRGDLESRAFYLGRIGHFALANTLMGAAGLAMAGLTLHYGLRHGVTLQFTPEAVGASLYGAGHAVAAIAERMIQANLAQVPINYDAPQPPSRAAAAPATPPSVLEKMITHGGTAISMLPVAHVAIHSVLTH